MLSLREKMDTLRNIADNERKKIRMRKEKEKEVKNEDDKNRDDRVATTTPETSSLFMMMR